MKINLVKSKNTNIYNNLAIEEYILNQDIKDIYLFFWKAKDANELIKKHKSWERIYGRTSKFTIEFGNNIYQIENGYIISINDKKVYKKEKFDFKNLLLNA